MNSTKRDLSCEQKYSKPTVLIYRNHLLPCSETFIRTQVSSMEVFDYCYVGTRCVEGLFLQKEKVITVRKVKSSQTLRELVYKLSGFSPQLYWQLDKLHPKLIHAHFGPDAIKAMPLARKLKIPLVVTFHGYDVTIRPSHAWRSSYSQLMYLLKKRRLKRSAVKFLAGSNFIKKALIDQGFCQDKVVTQYIGIDTELFSPKIDIHRKPIVLFVGRLVEVKGCDFLIRAMALVQQTLPNVELVIIGDGPLRRPLEKLAAEKLKHYRFLGFQSPSVVQQQMNSSSVFCVPSVRTKSGHEEAFGIVFIEAQSMGLPVVSFRSGGIPEAVEHEKTGFLAPERDIGTLATYLLKILEDRDTWQSFSQSAMTRVRDKFDIRRQTSKLENMYSEIISQHES